MRKIIKKQPKVRYKNEVEVSEYLRAKIIMYFFWKIVLPVPDEDLKFPPFFVCDKDYIFKR